MRPPGPSWAPCREESSEPLRRAALRFLAGLGVVFGSLFGPGEVILGSAGRGAAGLALTGLLLIYVLEATNVRSELS